MKIKGPYSVLPYISSCLRNSVFIISTAQKMKFLIKDFCSKCDQIRKIAIFVISGNKIKNFILTHKLRLCWLLLSLLKVFLTNVIATLIISAKLLWKLLGIFPRSLLNVLFTFNLRPVSRDVLRPVSCVHEQD